MSRSTKMPASRLAYGVYSLTGMYGSVEPGEALGILRFARSLGVEHFDTADVYGNGLGERLLGEAFPGGRGVFVATKVGYDFYSGGRPVRRYDREYLEKALRRSLERLGVESVDLLYIHNPPLEVLRGGEIYRFLSWARREGLIGMGGIALGPETDVAEEALEAVSHSEVEAVQFVYNMLEQEPGHTIAVWARERGVSAVARVPHAGGVLDESITPSEAEKLSDHRSLRRRGWYRWAFRVYGRMKPLLEGLPGTPGQKAIAFILSSAPVDSVVLIARSRERLMEYVSPESTLQLPRSVVEEIRRIYIEEVGESPEAPLKSLRLAGVL
ncbi:aldo/keto reductase [Aeropyrum pernix]|nr:aldo/keto reductase [Aeropyrum pernix]